MRVRLIWGFYLLFSTVSAAIARPAHNYYFKQVGIEQGLSQSTVNCLLCDSRGVMWIGTALGLNTVDKNEVRTYLHEKNDPYSLPGNQINFLAEDSLNNIWISTNRGLVRFQREKNQFIEAIPGQPIYTYAACPIEGGILFGGDRTIYKYSYKEKKITRLPLRLPNWTNYTEFNKLFLLNKNHLLISSKNNGIWLYELDRHILRGNLINPTIEINTASYVDKEGFLYISPYKSGLYCLDLQGNELYHLNTRNSGLQNDIILDIIEKDGQLWLATDGGGINILDKKSRTVSSIQHIPGDNGSLPVNSITCLYTDPGNNIWAGSVRGGMFGIKEVDIKTYKDVPLNHPNGLSEKTVISLYEDETGILWIGTDGGGINSYHPRQNRFKHYATTYGEKVVSITPYSEEELMVSFFCNGLYLFNKKTGQYRPFTIVNTETNKLECTSGYSALAYRTSHDEICILSRHIYIYNLNKKTFTPVTTEENPQYLQAQRLIYACDSFMYLIRENKIFEIKKGENKLRTVYTADIHRIINAACYDGDGKFWIGSASGLSSYNMHTQEFKTIPTNFFNTILSLTLDKQGRLWIGAQNMLFSYIIAEKRFVVWGESDGFAPNELYFIPPLSYKTDNIYMGGIAGLVKINKNISYTNYSLPQIKLTDVILNGTSCSDETVHHTQTIHIPWNYSSLIIKVASNEKDIFRQTLFRYEIKGLNHTPTESYNRSFTLPTLPPGSYSILCSCNTKNGEWTPAATILHFTVTPPWYQTNWFIFGSLFFIVLIICISSYLIIQKKENRLKWQMHEHELEVNEEKIRFLINVSHELRTPLTLIYAPLKRLLNTNEIEEDNRLASQLKRICKQAWQMKNIINMVLDMDKIKSNPLQLHPSRRLLNEWVKEVTENFRDEFENKQITIRYELDSEIQSLTFDVNKCEIILSNLLMNALKFSPSHSEIRISTRQNDTFIRISVADQGIGLEHTDTQKLFSRFYQGSHHIMGSGIGLSYAQTLIQIQGGHINALPNEGGGAVFYFELPQTPEGHEIPGTLLCQQNKNTELPQWGKNDYGSFSCTSYSVLLVEDEQELLLFLKDSLKDSFKHVYTAVNGKEGLQKIREFQPDIVVSYVMMPEMDGYQLCRSIKENIEISHIPVILLTAMGDKENISRGYKLGADTYISKPFDIDFLITMITNLLKNRENIKSRYKNRTLPSSPQETTISNADEQFLLKLNQVIEENLGNPNLNVNFLTQKIMMSRASLYQKMKALTNIGVNDYINKFRIEKAVDLLTHTDLSITEISEQLGFRYPRYFSSVFKQAKGVLPTTFRKQTNG